MKSRTREEQMDFNRNVHDASKAAGIFCPECVYSFNGVLDEFCEEPGCPEKKFEDEFEKSLK